MIQKKAKMKQRKHIYTKKHAKKAEMQKKKTYGSYEKTGKTENIDKKHTKK